MLLVGGAPLLDCATRHLLGATTTPVSEVTAGRGCLWLEVNEETSLLLGGRAVVLDHLLANLPKGAFAGNQQAANSCGVHGADLQRLRDGTPLSQD